MRLLNRPLQLVNSAVAAAVQIDSKWKIAEPTHPSHKVVHGRWCQQALVQMSGDHVETKCDLVESKVNVNPEKHNDLGAPDLSIYPPSLSLPRGREGGREGGYFFSTYRRLA
ncbi:unnamed protein product [Arctogadus glacialis]